MGMSGGSTSAQNGASETRRLAAIAFADVVGYSLLMSRDEQRTHERWMSLLTEVIRPLATSHHGRIVKSTGDGVLAEFPSTLNAVRWGQAVQESVSSAQSIATSPDPIALRISVHIGEVIDTPSDIYGDDVNIAARLEAHGEPGGMILSEAAYERVRGRTTLPVRDLGFLQLKNLERPIRAFAIDCGTRPRILRALLRSDRLPSIAVLPFQSLDQDPANQYFGDGVVEDIIVSLGSLRELFVISRASCLNFRGRSVDPREVGLALGVKYVVTGSIRTSPRLIRISVQLCDAQTGSIIWGDRTETAPGDLFDVQDKIVSRIVSGVAPHVLSAELQSALRKQPESFSAYDHTLKALSLFGSLREGVFKEAKTFLDKAIEDDPQFAMPLAWAARWRALCVGQGWSEDPKKDSLAAIELAQRAIDLDGQNALALGTYGHYQSYLFHRYDIARVYLDRALLSCPSSSLAWLLSSATLSYTGHGDEALEHAMHGLSLSPFDQSLFYHHMVLGLAHFGRAEYKDAVKFGRMSRNQNPKYSANLRILVAAQVGAGDLQEASETAAELLTVEPRFRVSLYDATLQPFCEEATRKRYIEYLRAAGLPN
jgi:adenylate cyclase